jgi:hypothetical protein
MASAGAVTFSFAFTLVSASVSTVRIAMSGSPIVGMPIGIIPVPIAIMGFPMPTIARPVPCTVPTTTFLAHAFAILGVRARAVRATRVIFRATRRASFPLHILRAIVLAAFATVRVVGILTVSVMRLALPALATIRTAFANIVEIPVCVTLTIRATRRTSPACDIRRDIVATAIPTTFHIASHAHAALPSRSAPETRLRLCILGRICP